MISWKSLLTLRCTYNVRRVDLLNEARVLGEIDVRTERYLIDSHLPLYFLTIVADEIVRLFQQILRGGNCHESQRVFLSDQPRLTFAIVPSIEYPVMINPFFLSGAHRSNNSRL